MADRRVLARCRLHPTSSRFPADAGTIPALTPSITLIGARDVPIRGNAEPPLSSAVGFNAYPPLLVTGVLARTTDLTTLAPLRPARGASRASVIAAIAVVDFIGGKVPAVDHAFHLVGAVVAPVVGAALAVAVTQDTGDLPRRFGDPRRVGGGRYSRRALSVRPFSTLTTGGIGNPILSLGEDGLSATLSFLAIVVPLMPLPHAS